MAMALAMAMAMAKAMAMAVAIAVAIAMTMAVAMGEGVVPRAPYRSCRACVGRLGRNNNVFPISVVSVGLPLGFGLAWLGFGTYRMQLWFFSRGGMKVLA